MNNEKEALSNDMEYILNNCKESSLETSKVWKNFVGIVESKCDFIEIWFRGT